MFSAGSRISSGIRKTDRGTDMKAAILTDVSSLTVHSSKGAVIKCRMLMGYLDGIFQSLYQNEGTGKHIE